MHIPILPLCRNRTVLSGAAPGRELLASLVKAVTPQAGPTAVFLDFTGIEVATSSFLRESVIGFRDYARTSLENLYPVIANAAAPVLEELEFFVRQRGDVVWCCRRTKSGTISEARIIGDLDPAQKATFDAVVEMGKASAPELSAKEPGLGSTAWNNRLSWLSSKGLLVEQRAGKTKTFSPVLEVS